MWSDIFVLLNIFEILLLLILLFVASMGLYCILDVHTSPLLHARSSQTPDPEVEFRAHTRQQGEGQLLAGTADVVIEGPRTDADAYQVADPNVGHRVGGVAPPYQLATPPIAASETRADRRAHLHSTPYPIEVMESGPLPSVSGTMVTEVGQGGRTGSTLGGFVDPCPSRQPPPESAVTSNLGEAIPVTTGARTSTTATITSTYVTCSTCLLYTSDAADE